MVYALHSADESVIKIGVTVNLPLRISVFNSLSKLYSCRGICPLRLLVVTPGGRAEEKALQRRLASYQSLRSDLLGMAMSEWFRSTPGVLQVIKALPAAPIPDGICKHGFVLKGMGKCAICKPPKSVRTGEPSGEWEVRDGMFYCKGCEHLWAIRKPGGAARCPRCQKPR